MGLEYHQGAHPPPLGAFSGKGAWAGGGGGVDFGAELIALTLHSALPFKKGH
jgi:hypothetical protein